MAFCLPSDIYHGKGALRRSDLRASGRLSASAAAP